jgi:hypothetical protein
MASEVFSGTSNFSYSNSTGQNVRIIINYARASNANNVTMSWGSAGAVSVAYNNVGAFGRNLASFVSLINTNTDPVAISANNVAPTTNDTGDTIAFPTEIMISNGHTFSLSNVNAYNIVIIKEDGS